MFTSIESRGRRGERDGESYDEGRDDVPTLVMHGDDDQIVPIANSALLSAKLLNNSTLKVYEELSHGMCTTHVEVVNPDLLAFIKS